MRSILTPKTIYKNRTSLNKLLAQISGEEFSLENLGNWELQVHRQRLLDAEEKKLIVSKIKPSLKQFHLLMKLWLIRTRHLIKIRSQVAGILEQYCQPTCIFCKYAWGLKCEGINDIEETFQKFLQDSNQQRRLERTQAKERDGRDRRDYSYEYWDLADWQLYYRLHTVFRTLCYRCYEEIYYTKKWNQENHRTAY